MKFDVIEELVSQECIEAIKEEFKKYKIESGICDIEKFEKNYYYGWQRCKTS